MRINILKKGTVPSANDNQKPRDIEETIFNIPEINPTNLSKKDFTINYTSGQKHKYIELKNGLKHGKAYFWDEDGNKTVKQYKEGNEIAIEEDEKKLECACSHPPEKPHLQFAQPLSSHAEHKEVISAMQNKNAFSLNWKHYQASLIGELNAIDKVKQLIKD